MNKTKHFNILEFIIFFLLILYISNTATVCFNESFSRIVTVIFSSIFIIKRKKIDAIAILICIFWLFINILYSIFHYVDFSINKIIGYLLPFIITYTGYKCIDGDFFKKFEKWIYTLTTISLAIYVLQLATGGLFNTLTPIFGKYIADFYSDASPNAWYIFIYTYNPFAYSNILTRNSGFMWEPGGFALICTFGLLYRHLKYGKRINLQTVIYIIAIISTMSTAGYIALMLYFTLYVTNSKNVFTWIIFAGIFISIIPVIYELEFISEKINGYMLNINESAYNPRYDGYEYNRFSIFLINLKNLIEFPIGYGVYEAKDFYGHSFIGVNGIATFARMWGVIGFIFSIISIFKTFKLFNKGNNWLSIVLAFSSIIVMFFSNPIERSPLIYLLIIYPYIVQKQCKQKTYQGYRLSAPLHSQKD